MNVPRRTVRCVPWFTAVALCLVSACGETGKSEDYASFDAFVEQTRHVYQVPGAAVAIVRDTGVLFIKGYGVRSIGGAAPVDTSTRFQIASNSKFMTGALIGTLVDAQRTTWDQPLKEHYPALALATAQATAAVSFRDLLSHRSGLPAYDGDLLSRLGLGKAEIIRRAQFMPLDSFRDQARYSNMGFYIAGEIGAQISKLQALDWETHIRQALFEPLGMTRSSARPLDIFTDDNHVAGHRLKNGQVELMDLETDLMGPAGAVVSTADDMARWLRMLLNRGRLDGTVVLRPATVDEICRNSIETGNGGFLGESGTGFGLGTENYTFLGRRVVTKNGALDGVRTYVALIPDLKMGIVVLANLNMTVFPEAVTARFLEDHLGAAGKDLQADLRDNQQKQWDFVSSPPIYPAAPAKLTVDLASLAGNYTNAIYGDFTVTADGTALKIVSNAPKAYTGKLTHWDGLRFLLEWPDPDDVRGLVELQLSRDQTQITGFAGVMPDAAYRKDHRLFIVDYRQFTRN